MRLNLRIVLVGAVAAALASTSLRADFVTIPQPSAAYLSSTTLASFTDPDQTLIGALASGNETLVYNNLLEDLTVPGSWPNWGKPPAVESADPRVGYTSGNSSLGIGFSKPVSVFGFEVSPNYQQPEQIAAQFFSGTMLVGTITLSPNGSGGALLYAASTGTNPFTSVLITDNDSGDFAIAEQRFAIASTPEPATFALSGLALLAVVAGVRRRLLSAMQKLG